MSKFQQRHYKTIAQTLRDARPPYCGEESYEQWRRTVEKFASSFTADNSKFKQYLFFAACGYGDKLELRSDVKNTTIWGAAAE